MLIDKSITDFVDDLASNSPMPGGGGVAALAGALGAGLGLMVCSLTAGKEKYRDMYAAIHQLQQQGTHLKEELVQGIDGDGHSYLGIVNAHKLPKGNEMEVKIRNKAIQEATKEAARFSLSVAQKCLQVMNFAADVIKSGNLNAVSESLGSGLLAYAGVYTALVTVEINLVSIHDQLFIQEILAIDHSLKKQAEVLKAEITSEAAKRIIINGAVNVPHTSSANLGAHYSDHAAKTVAAASIP